jgi:hypothetical protein
MEIQGAGEDVSYAIRKIILFPDPETPSQTPNSYDLNKYLKLVSLQLYGQYPTMRPSTATSLCHGRCTLVKKFGVARGQWYPQV